jgi:hypothetical protein
VKKTLKPSRKTGSKGGRSFSVNEMAEVLMTLPEISESFTRADLELALDDRGWINPMSQNSIGEMDPASRKILVTRARMYWSRDPLAHQAVRLWTDYGIGDGVSFNVAGKKKTATGAKVPSGTNPTQQKLNKFWKARTNRKLLSSRGMQRLSRKLLVDGEIFFAIFGAPDAEDKKIRIIDPLQVTDRITDPDDDEHVLCYRRVLPSNNKPLYYADWTATEDDLALAQEQKDPQTGKTITLEEDVVIYHLPFDDFGWRGNGLLLPALDWSREHRRFMEARVAITQALSKFAHKLTMKGGQALLDQMKRKLQSSQVERGGSEVERNPQTAAGGTWLQNAGLQLDQMPRATGAGDAKQDGDGLKLMVCAATNIMLHYFGDPSTGNLATATAMELPMLKSFTAYQRLWTDAIRDIFSIVLNETEDEEPTVIDIDLPPILKDDLRNLGQAITAIAAIFPEIGVDEVLQAMMVALGLNNVEDVMDSIREKRDELAANEQKQQDATAKALALAGKSKPGQGSAPAPLAPNLSTEAAQQLTAALVKVAEAIAA